MRRWFAEAGSAALALVLALVVWAVAEQAGNPSGIVRQVPVGIRGLEEGVAFSHSVTAAVDVRLRASSQVLTILRVEDFEAYVDLVGLEAGEHRVPVQVVSSQGDVQILGIDPGSVDVSLESVAEKLVPVRVEVMDSPAFGYDAGEPQVEPTAVRVSGPSQYVESAEVAVAEVYLRAARSTVEARRLVSLRAQGGQVLSGGGEWTPRIVTVTVPIEQRPGYRDVNVRVRWGGQPARGYRISEVAVDPSIVTLFGSAAGIEAAPGYVETMPVNIEGASGNVVERLALLVPENVSVFGVQSVVVSVGITAIEESAWVQRSPIIQGLDDTLRVELSPQVVEVLLVGPLPRLETLRPGDVQVVLDLTGLQVGTHSLAPSLVLPEGLRQETLVPETVEARISQVPTVTPSSTPAPTATTMVTGTPGVTPTITLAITLTVTPSSTAAVSAATATAAPSSGG